MKECKISVIVPIYKVDKYLDNCIDSIVNQTYKNLEIILVDDGSPDQCPKICDKWAKRDSRIKVIHKPNGGVSSARNAGLDAAGGGYIGFVDGDDRIEKDMYEILLRDCIQKNADVSACSVQTFHDQTQTFGNGFQYDYDEKVYSSQELLEVFFRSCNGHWVSLCNKIIKRSAFHGLRFPEGRIFEDWTLAPMIYFQCEKISYLPVKKYIYIVHSHSAMRTETLRRYADCVSADADHYAFFNKKGVTQFNQSIQAFLWADFFKCCKVYTPSKKNRKLLKETYQKCTSVCKSKRGSVFYRFPNTIHMMFKIKQLVKK